MKQSLLRWCDWLSSCQYLNSSEPLRLSVDPFLTTSHIMSEVWTKKKKISVQLNRSYLHTRKNDRLHDNKMLPNRALFVSTMYNCFIPYWVVEYSLASLANRAFVVRQRRIGWSYKTRPISFGGKCLSIAPVMLAYTRRTPNKIRYWRTMIQGKMGTTTKQANMKK